MGLTVLDLEVSNPAEPNATERIDYTRLRRHLLGGLLALAPLRSELPMILGAMPNNVPQ